MRSIAHRIYRVIALVSVVSVAAMFVSTTLVNEDLEHTMLGEEMAQEREFFLEQNPDLTQPVHSVGPRRVLAYLPKVASTAPGQESRQDVPEIFEGRSAPFSGEISSQGETYLVSISELPEGILYLARNISHFEARERLFQMALLVVGGLIALMAVALSIMAARRVVKPLGKLAEQIQQVPVGAHMVGLPTTWQDTELQTIAESFNDFVAQLQAYVRREKSLLSLASHELRTPIAVVSGALDILEQRDHLTPADKATVARIRRATSEMQNNVGILLALARKDGGSSLSPVTLSLATELNKVLEDLSVDFPVAARVVVQALAPAVVVADAAMVRMLLRNLVQNALQHTTARVYITLQANQFEIRDEGQGLGPSAREVLLGARHVADSEGPVGGLGLYLVTLMAERLGWVLALVDSSAQGTVVRVSYLNAAGPPVHGTTAFGVE